MSCPYFKEGIFGICVAPDAIHVPSISEMEKFCFRSWYGSCPNLATKTFSGDAERTVYRNTVSPSQEF